MPKAKRPPPITAGTGFFLMKFIIPPPEEPEAVELVDSDVVCDMGIGSLVAGRFSLLSISIIAAVADGSLAI